MAQRIKNEKEIENLGEKKIEIKFNAYTYELEILESTYELNDNSKVMLTIKKNKEKGLHFWYKELINAISEDFNDKSFKLIFNGRNEEYSDIFEEVTYLQKNGWKIQSEINPLKENKNILGELEVYIKDVMENAPEQLKEEIKEKKAIEEFEIAKNTEAEVSIIATMSSGKSTLLNAILGKEILPSKNEACTATICRIKDVHGLKKFRLKAETLEGEIISDWQDITSDEITKFNEEGNTKGINLFVEGDIPGINSGEMNLVLIDTPGPNNSQNMEHKELTYKFIKDTRNNPLVLYVMNATQAATNDDAKLLSEISEIVKKNGKQAEERFIFALNKIDCFDPEKESIETLIENSKKYLKSFGIENPKIFPLSAEAAKLVRLRECGEELSRTQKANLNAYEYNFLPEDDYLGIDTIKYASISDGMKEKLYEEANEDKVKGLLHYSGITAIEIYIDRYVNKYAKTQKVKDSVSTLKKVVDNAYSEVKLLSGKTSEEIDEIVNQINEIEEILKTRGKNKIDEVKNKIDKLQGDTSEYANFFMKIEEKFLNIEEEFDDNFKITEEKAILILEDANKELEDLYLSLKTSAQNVVNKEIQLKANEIIEKLKKYFYDVIGEVSVSKELKNVLESKFNLEVPRISSLLKEGVYTVNEKVGERFVRTRSTSKWYNPFSWGDTEDVYEDVYESKKYVDLSRVRDMYLSPTKHSFRKGIEASQNQMFKKIDKLKEESKEKLSVVEKNVEQKVKEMKQRVKDQEKLLEKNETFKIIIDDIVRYKNELDKILNN